MIPDGTYKGLTVKNITRTCGDDPRDAELASGTFTYYPHMRG